MAAGHTPVGCKHEWFGHNPDCRFSKQSVRILNQKLPNSAPVALQREIGPGVAG
jgi:hypothetical protein